MGARRVVDGPGVRHRTPTGTRTVIAPRLASWFTLAEGASPSDVPGLGFDFGGQTAEAVR